MHNTNKMGLTIDLDIERFINHIVYFLYNFLFNFIFGGIFFWFILRYHSTKKQIALMMLPISIVLSLNRIAELYLNRYMKRLIDSSIMNGVIIFILMYVNALFLVVWGNLSIEIKLSKIKIAIISLIVAVFFFVGKAYVTGVI